MAVIVNGEGLPDTEFQSEIQRYLAAQSAQGSTINAETASQVVMDDMVNQILLAQGAGTQGYIVDDAALQERINGLATDIGGIQALAEWQAAHGYTDISFRSSLRRQIAAAWMRDQIAADVPAVADQVHVKQILFYNADDAHEAWVQLQGGKDFNSLAAQYDPLTQGELGWFPRGYLLEPVIEDAAFSLEPGQYSQVLESTVGYQIIQVIERDPLHPLTPDARLALQYLALQDWLAQQRDQSTIILTP